MIEKGMLLRCKTNTKNDTFGTVLWEVMETGVAAPERERQGIMDGVVVSMLCGTGPSAREGFVVVDSEDHIQRDIKAGITTIIPASQKDAVVAQLGRTPKSAIGSNIASARERIGSAITRNVKHGGSGVVEI
jgi:hypothetical protein